MIWSIQVLRFVAASMIVYVHAHYIAFAVTGSSGILPQRLADVTVSGVDIFFVISGLIIAKVAPGRTPSEFIVSRVKRILPMYFIFTIPSVVVQIATKGFGWRDFISSFLLWPVTDKFTVPALQVGWTLCFEMLFYACAALALFNRWFVAGLVGMYGAAIALRSNGPLFEYIGNPIIVEFMLGVAIAYAPSYRLGILALPLGIVLLITVGVIGLIPISFPMDTLSGHDGLQRILTLGIPSALIVYGALQLRVGESSWSYLGEASYSLYLSHFYIVIPSYFFWQKLHLPADFIIVTCFFVSLLFAWRIHERVEKPIIAFFKQKAPSRA